MVESYGGSGGGGGRGFDRRPPGGGGNWGNFGGGDWNIDSIFSMKDISPKTKAHLTRVYTTLLTSSGACGVGMWMNETLMIGGFIMMILFMFLQMFFIYQVKNPNNSEQSQIGYLLALAFAMGFMVGPGIHAIAAVNPAMLTQGVLYTTTAFGSFSAVSLFSERRSFLFLGGIISTMLSVLCMYSMVGWLMGGSSFGLGYIMCSLFVACLWIIFDTQVIIEQSEAGHKNVPDHSMTLFIDLFRLFIKILQVLQALEQNKNKKKK